MAGISVRTNNIIEREGDGKISGLWERFFEERVSQKIKGAIDPGTILAVYSDYQKDSQGDYTLTIGHEVPADFSDDKVFNFVHVPASDYKVFSSESGKVPEIVINLWQKIWSWERVEKVQKRSFMHDLEVYGHGAIDQENAQMDIYIGLETKK